MKFPYKIILFCLVVIVLAPHCASAIIFNDYLEYFYNRYSQHFDTNGLKYAVPDYGIKKMTFPAAPREIIGLASYYKFRALKNDLSAQSLIKNQIIKSLTLLETQTHFSFNDSEALFLSYILDKQITNLLSFEEKVRLNQTILSLLENGLLAKDTENRAFISAAHFQFLINEFYNKGLINSAEKVKLDQLAKEKTDSAIKQSISPAGWYRENKLFSAHYQAVSAYMLLIYSQLTKNSEYQALIYKMYTNLKSLSFDNGLIEAKIGHRPTGLGAQFYLMMGLIGTYFQDEEANTFLSYSQGNTFFRDKKYPNRLEYHCTACSQSSNFHDDYAFSDVAELSLVLLSPTSSINLSTKNKISVFNLDDSEFKITHQKKIITIKDKIKRNNLIIKQSSSEKNYLKKYFY